MISSSDGTSPAEIAPATARPASAQEPNAATIVHGACGRGRSATVASVMIPSVPSEPTNSLARS